MINLEEVCEPYIIEAMIDNINDAEAEWGYILYEMDQVALNRAKKYDFMYKAKRIFIRKYSYIDNETRFQANPKHIIF